MPEDTSLPQHDYSSPHDFALLYLIFAVGALVDLKLEPCNPEGEHYHQLARAALVLQPVLEKPSLVTIQALHLLSIYNGMAGNENSGGETSLETTWSLVAFAAQLSHSVGRVLLNLHALTDPLSSIRSDCVSCQVFDLL